MALSDQLRVPRFTRRQFARGGGAAAAASLVAGALPAGRVFAATPNTAHTKVLFRPGYNQTGQVVTEVFDKALAPFRQKNPSLDVQFVWYDPGVGGWTSEILAGAAPDVFEYYLFNQLASSGYLLNLTPYVKSSNVDLSVFPTAQMQFFTQNGHLHGFPVTNEWTVNVINLTLLDKLGLSYPSKNWTVQEAAAFYRQAARPSANPNDSVYGGHFWMYYSDTPSAMYLAPFGASVVDEANRAHAGTGTPEMLAATNYMNTLIQDNVCTWSNGLGWNHFLAGKVAVALASDWILVTVAQATRTAGFNFDFWPMPVGPKGSATYGSEAYYAIPATTKQPDAAWALLEYVATTPAIPRVMLDLWLYPPPSLNLGEEYLARIRQLAPPLRNKNIEAFIQLTNHAVQPPFEYEDTQAETLVSQYFGDVWNKKMAPSEALTLATKQVDALEAVGASTEVSQRAALAKVEALNTAKGPVHLAPPPVKGIGVPAKAAPSFALHSGSTYTLLGVGSDCWGTSDNCIYACVPTTSSVESFVCRVTALANVNCPQLSPWTKVGLMARGDLSDDAAMVFLGVTGGNGIALEERPVAGGQPGNENADGGHSGLMAAQYVARNPAQPAANYLLQPIWLKLARTGSRWSAYTSLDGKTWSPGGIPASIEATSAWIGIFACAHNTDFSNKGYARASFDHLSFTPTAVYQVGQSGTPPAAGAVPSNWATLTTPAKA